MRVQRTLGSASLTVALACAMAGEAVAGVHVNSVWIVEPSVPSSQVQALAPGEMLVTARLIPPSLAVLSQPLTDPLNPSFPIPAGTQLFGTLDGSIWNTKRSPFPVFCEFKGFVAEPGKRSRGDIHVRRCLIDSNNDKTFDGIFQTVSCLAEFPNIANLDLPKKPAAISAPYEEISPTAIKDGPTVGIVFDGFNYMNGGPRFFRAFGNGSAIPVFGRMSQKKSKDGLVELFGARFVIHQREADRVNVELREGIPLQPFAMGGGGLCLG